VALILVSTIKYFRALIPVSTIKYFRALIPVSTIKYFAAYLFLRQPGWVMPYFLIL
jgi:hypothetical protein